MIQTDSTAEPQFAAFVAIDWADQKHAWSLQAAGSDQREADEMKHTPEAVGAWVSMLSARFAGQPIAVALEQSHGALVFMLGQYADLHLYPIHPRAAAQFRAALYPSGAKDDPVDADLLLDMLVLHRKHIRPLRPDNQPTRLVQHQVEARRRLVNEKTRQVQRLTAKLKIYFPRCWTGSTRWTPLWSGRCCIAGPPCQTCRGRDRARSDPFARSTTAAMRNGSRSASRKSTRPFQQSPMQP